MVGIFSSSSSLQFRSVASFRLIETNNEYESVENKKQNIWKQITDKRTLRHLKKSIIGCELLHIRDYTHRKHLIFFLSSFALNEKKETIDDENKCAEWREKNPHSISTHTTTVWMRVCHGSFGRDTMMMQDIQQQCIALRFSYWCAENAANICMFFTAKVAFISRVFCNLRDVVPLFFFHSFRSHVSQSLALDFSLIFISSRIT